MKPILGFVAITVLMTGVGLGTGYYAALQTMDHGADAESTPTDAGVEAALDPTMLAGLGVVIGKVHPSKPRLTTRINAVVEDAADTTRVVSAPFSGRVLSLDAKIGSVVDGTSSIVTVVRDGLPPFEPKRAASILKPVHEELHDAYAELLIAYRKRQILAEQLERFDRIDARSVSLETGGRSEDNVPLVSKQRLIELQNDLREAVTKFDGLEHKVLAHGLTKEEIDRILAGGHPPHGSTLWKRALSHHGLWPKDADAILAVLPEARREEPLVIACLGELAASGLLDSPLVQAMTNSPAMQENFTTVTRLRLDGVDVARITGIAMSGGLAPTMRLSVPRDADTETHDRFDVVAFHVAIGQHVDAGTTLATLRDPKMVHLVLEPIGDEVAALRSLLAAGGRFRATPLIEGTGPTLNDLELGSLGVLGGESVRPGGIRARATVTNEAVNSTDGKSRTWSLLPGIRYVAEVTNDRPGDAIFVLPQDAIVKRGSMRVVLVVDTDHVHPHEVQIVGGDDDNVFVAPGVLEDGEQVVLRGALALSLALDRSGEAAGHDHGHDH
ncbi:MAG: efflux RND transporter periplasmic adaptor subunit [Planctomycetes bacterium]|nr:efflux RND transporter periplasmic adaptor subunit [Planctomycetota bacterium]